jgi:hypothetical protein
VFHYTLFDVHYYLAGWKPKNPGQVMVVGGAFHPIAGRYVLPCGEGEFVVGEKDGQGWLTMFTRSAGQSYDHPLVSLQHTDMRLDYGWYSHVTCDVHSTYL